MMDGLKPMFVKHVSKMLTAPWLSLDMCMCWYFFAHCWQIVIQHGINQCIEFSSVAVGRMRYIRVNSAVVSLGLCY